MSDTDERAMNRLRFVKLAGAGAGAALVAPIAGVSAARAATALPLNVGVLAPTGASYSNMGRSLVDGLTLGFDAARAAAVPVQATIVQREVDRGFGNVRATTEALLDGGVEVVVAGISALAAQGLNPLFASRRASLVVANVGAHVVAPAPAGTLVLHNTLLYWQASYALGRWAATIGKRGFLAASASDSGYDALYAFRRGYESNGGTIVGDEVTHVDPADSGLSTLFTSVKRAGANVLCGLYSGNAATELVRAHGNVGSGARLLLGSLGVDDFMLPGLGDRAAGVTSCSSWTEMRNSSLNQAFVKAFTSRFGRRPDPFAALGYDTAALVAEGARRAAKKGLGPARLVEALDGAWLDGPRGRLTVEAATRTVTGPLFIRQVKRAGGAWANADVVQASSVTGLPAPLAALASGARSGYINEYLCA